MNKVRDENDTVMDKARVLIDLVIGKGPKSCLKFIKHLCEEDPQLACKDGFAQRAQMQALVSELAHSNNTFLPPQSEDGALEHFRDFPELLSREKTFL
ncbi:hypothetical protein H8959_003270 [Pygathrix nigripes]